MLPVFSAARQRSAPDGSQEHELQVSGSDHSLFQGWIKGCDDEAVCAYFRAVGSGLAERQLQHYHFKICNGRFDVRTKSQAPKWYCTVFYGAQDATEDASALRNGPIQVPRCMPCDLNCPLLLGITGDDQDSKPGPVDEKPAAAATATAVAVTVADAAPQAAASPPAAATTAEPAAAATATALAAAATMPAADHKTDPPLQPDNQQPGLTDGPTEQGQQHQQQQQQAVVKQDDPLQPQQQQQQQQHIVRSRDSLVRESEHCRVWFDAKGRPMFVVTPQQHIEQLADLSDTQLVDLFRTAVAVLDDMGCGCISMVLNQGDNRNHAHLHLKVKVHEKEFDRAVAGWSDQHKQQLQAIRAFRETLPPEHRGTHEAFMLRLRQARRGGGGGGRGEGGGRWSRGRGRGSDGDWRQGQQRHWQQHGHHHQQQQQGWQQHYPEQQQQHQQQQDNKQ